jgi:hypothetical protein
MILTLLNRSINLGEHRIANDLISRVLVMNRLLPRINPHQQMDQTYIDQGRARSCIASTAVWFHMYVSLFRVTVVYSSVHGHLEGVVTDT